MAEDFKTGDIVLTPISDTSFGDETGRVVGPARVDGVAEGDLYEVTFALGPAEALPSEHGVVGPYVGRYHGEELQRVEAATLADKYAADSPTFTADEIGAVPAERPDLH